MDVEVAFRNLWFYREGPNLSSGTQIILMPLGWLSYWFFFVLTKTEMCSYCILSGIYFWFFNVWVSYGFSVFL